MKVIFYYDPRSLNDATSYYVSLIEKAFNNNSIKVIYHNSLPKVNKEDIIFTITEKYFFKAKLKYPFNKTVYWAQGVLPEEYLVYGKNKVKFLAKEIIEKIAIKKNSLLFLVSNKMLEHYHLKYKYNKNSYVIMPCYNIRYDRGIFKN